MSVPPAVVVTGMGIVSALAADIPAFLAALREGCSAIAEVAGRPMATLSGFDWTRWFERAADEEAARARRVLRAAPLASRAACCAALEACRMAGLPGAVDPDETAVIVAGHNLHQRYITETFRHYLDKPAFLNPRFAFSFLDSHALGSVAEVLGLRGPGFMAGGGFASGNVALYQALQLLRSGDADACLCIGGLADFSDFELRAFDNLGAHSPGGPDGDAAQACRPFDRGRNGFVYGQASGCLVLETADHARRRQAPALAELVAVGLVMDGHHAAEPNRAGEARAMRRALARAGIDPGSVDYLNAHATGAGAGDDAECAAILDVFGAGKGPWVNATKALTGHTLFAAGIVEMIATILQMQGGFVHGNPNLTDPIKPTGPIDGAPRFAGRHAVPAEIRSALSNSFSFGGINSSAVVRRPQPVPQSAERIDPWQ